MVGPKTIDQITVTQSNTGSIASYVGTTTDDEHVQLTKKDYQAWIDSHIQTIKRTVYHRYDGRLAVSNLKVDWRFFPLFMGGSLLVIIVYLIRLILKVLAYFQHNQVQPLFHNLIRLDLLIAIFIFLVGFTQWTYTNVLNPMAFDFFQSSHATAPTKAKIVRKQQTILNSLTTHGHISTTTDALTLRFQNEYGITQKVVRNVPPFFYRHQKIGDSLTVLPYVDNSGGVKIIKSPLSLPNFFQALLVLLNFALIWVLPRLFGILHLLLTNLHTKNDVKKVPKHHWLSVGIIAILLTCSVVQGAIQAKFFSSNYGTNQIKQVQKLD
ncbi:hypothetical protein N6G94_04525 [Pediococcus inopinatus]|uniref:hypothetical protein n=1 Tax=Pediococcus inopinatus TaxID=114090 RepID=UPI002B25D396|nr:hypothetical protein [Pediococcus inopinatus]WPC18268.1 hypothetical protein N6G94_04525 [Pediococcus inopinatus]